MQPLSGTMKPRTLVCELSAKYDDQRFGELAARLKLHNMEIAGCFGPLAGKVFRIGTMGIPRRQKTCSLFWRR